MGTQRDRPVRLSQWFGWVCYGGHSAASVKGNTLEELLTDMVQTVCYYVGLGYEVVWVRSIVERCGVCAGDGVVVVKRKVKKCTACGGRGRYAELPDFRVLGRTHTS